MKKPLSASVTVAATATVTATALVSGLVVGAGEIINQSVQKGAENINLLSIATETFVGAADGAMAAGALFAGPSGKLALAAGRVGLSAFDNWMYGVHEGYISEEIGRNVAEGIMVKTLFCSSMAFAGGPVINTILSAGASKGVKAIYKIINNKYFIKKRLEKHKR